MPLPTSGPLGINAIRNELGVGNSNLRTLSSIAGKSTPDAISEFYGYSAATVPYIYQAPNVLFDFAATANYGNGIVSIPDLGPFNNDGTFTVGTLGGSATNASGFVNSGLTSGYEFQTSPEYSIRSDESNYRMQATSNYTIAIWYFHRGWQTSYPGIDTFGGNFEWVISNDVGGARMWHRRGGNYAFINFASQGLTYNVNQWHFVVIRFSYPTVSIDWYSNDGTRHTSTTTNYGNFCCGSFQIPLRYNNYLYARVGYYSLWGYDIGTGGADTVFNATRARYGR